MRPFLWKSWRMMYFCNRNAPVAKLVYAPDLGSGVARRVGSSPIRRTFFSACSPFDDRRKGIFSFLSSTPVLRRGQRDAQHAQRDNILHTIPTHRESVTRCDEAMRKTRGHFRKTSLVCVNTCGVSFNASAFSLPSHAHTRSSANFDNLPSPFTSRHIALIKNYLR